MIKPPINILQVSESDSTGGADKIAWMLHQAYQIRRYNAWLAVGHKYSQDPYTLLISHTAYRGLWENFWMRLSKRLSPFWQRSSVVRRAYWISYQLGHAHLRQALVGYENFNFPATAHVLDFPPQKPDILHCHNLHGDYFDLRVLPQLSQQLPVILTLHDAWLLSGHCAHSFDCERWKIGCGQCPGLTIHPGILRDATAYNWQRKQEIYAKSRLYVTTPCRWLMQKVEHSMLASAVIESRIIPHGTDLSRFHPSDKQAVRLDLGISPKARMILFAANGIRRNPWKDYLTLRSAIALVAERLPKQHILFIALGETGPEEQVSPAKVEFVPFQKDPAVVARYYQAADVYVHAAKADTFPNTILEALACGTPVVATAIGGIPEQIEDGVTGFLVPPGNAEAMAASIQKLLQSPTLQEQMGVQAVKAARQRFDLERMVDDYLEWYQEILQQHPHISSTEV